MIETLKMFHPPVRASICLKAVVLIFPHSPFPLSIPGSIRFDYCYYFPPRTPTTQSTLE